MESSGSAVIPAGIVTGVVLPDGPAVHYSTGRLTRTQATVVNAWRARLRAGQPLDGQPYLPGGDGVRPRASCSDAVAAAVADLLLRHRPGAAELARYAYASMQATRARGRDGSDGAQLYPPVSWYLPCWLTAVAEQLRADAFDAALLVREEAEAEAARLYPGTTRVMAMARCLHVAAVLSRAGLPFARQVPRGAIARMAIDSWALRHPDDVTAATVAYAAEVHIQPHRARRDMRRLER